MQNIFQPNPAFNWSLVRVSEIRLYFFFFYSVYEIDPQFLKAASGKSNRKRYHPSSVEKKEWSKMSSDLECKRSKWPRSSRWWCNRLRTISNFAGEKTRARGERLYKSFCPLSSLSKAHCAAALCQARHDNFYGLERRELGTNFAGPSF